jgi:DNA polymerase (family 10)
MARACVEQGFEYLVISDHSKSAFYANGLSEERIREQHRYIDELNARLAPFHSFKSIECDILNDGRLDYSDQILSTFDLVITSVHSNLKMTEEKAMSRLLGAIQNPHSRMLGHTTGRRLLSCAGYPVYHKTLIDACAEQRCRDRTKHIRAGSIWTGAGPIPWRRSNDLYRLMRIPSRDIMMALWITCGPKRRVTAVII